MRFRILRVLRCCFDVQPPFNTAARAQAKFTEAWYLPIAAERRRPKPLATPAPLASVAACT